MNWTKQMAKEYRAARGFGLVKMGKHLGVSNVTIQNIENGKVLDKYAHLLTQSYEAWQLQRSGNFHNEDQQRILKNLDMEDMIKKPTNQPSIFQTPMTGFRTGSHKSKYKNTVKRLRYCTHCEGETMQTKSADGCGRGAKVDHYDCSICGKKVRSSQEYLKTA